MRRSCSGTALPISCADLVGLAVEAAQGDEELVAEVLLVDLEEHVGVAAVGHEVADAFVHRHADRGDQARHRGDDRVEARADHHVAAAQHADEVVHVVGVADEQGALLVEAGVQVLAGVAVELLHADQDREEVALAAEVVDRVGEGLQVGVVLAAGRVAVVVEVDRLVVLVLVLAAERVGGGLEQVGLDGPPERVDRADDEDLLRPSQPASRSSCSPRARGAGSKVQAVSAPEVVRMPIGPRTAREGSLRQMTSEPLHTSATNCLRLGVIAPASAP
jgi:hypothetical protein